MPGHGQINERVDQQITGIACAELVTAKGTMQKEQEEMQEKQYDRSALYPIQLLSEGIGCKPEKHQQKNRIDEYKRKAECIQTAQLIERRSEDEFLNVAGYMTE